MIVDFVSFLEGDYLKWYAIIHADTCVLTGVYGWGFVCLFVSGRVSGVCEVYFNGMHIEVSANAMTKTMFGVVSRMFVSIHIFWLMLLFRDRNECRTLNYGNECM